MIAFERSVVQPVSSAMTSTLPPTNNDFLFLRICSMDRPAVHWFPDRLQQLAQRVPEDMLPQFRVRPRQAVGKGYQESFSTVHGQP
jgi:hypothetical protein